MCGIIAILNKETIYTNHLLKASAIVSHRGPDDEGYLLWSANTGMQVFAGPDTAGPSHDAFGLDMLPTDVVEWKVGLGHRRLSILDLSPSGHQPMVLASRGLAITYNGEVYNYVEVRTELENLGHEFHTASDTEVILHAWAEWGPSSLRRFNGMFAFVLLDEKQGKLYAVRDRFGVKPIYYADTKEYLAFASEAKQLRVLPSYAFVVNEQIAYDYLRYGLSDHSEETFETGIRQLLPGFLMEVDLGNGKQVISKWYSLVPREWRGDDKEAVGQFYDLLKDSVRLRMRSDVPVGSALSGGLDSSTVVCLMREVLREHGMGDHALKTITSCQEDKRYDEWEYAEAVVKATKAESFKVFPSFEKLQEDLDRLLWHLDFPFGSTSQFSQWCVFEEAGKRGLTVMIDGQGADEQLAGYGGNDMALYSGLLRKGHLRSWISEAVSYRKRKGSWPYGFLLGSVQQAIPPVKAIVPARYRPHVNGSQSWLKGNFRETLLTGRNLREHLTVQVQKLPLPALLRYEDRLSMAFSVESRVPFMDYRLIEFTLGLPERMIYRHGQRKYVLRKTFRGLVPDNVLDRQDKMGFVSPEERWMKEDRKEWFMNQFMNSHPGIEVFVDKGEWMHYLHKMQVGRVEFNLNPWRIISLKRWLWQRHGC